MASYASTARSWETAHSDVQVQVHGDVAVVIGHWVAKGKNKDEVFDYSARFITVYVKRDGRWQIAAEQSTPIKS